MLTNEIVDRIRRFRGHAFPVLSVYLNLGPDIREGRSVRARMHGLLKPIRAAIPSMNHYAATSMQKDIDTVVDLEKRIAGENGHGVAIFACARGDLLEYLSLPARVWDVAVAVDRPYLRPLDTMLEEFHRICAVIVDRRRSQVYELYMNEIESRQEIVEEGRLLSNFGGWHGLAEYGARHHAEEAAHHHYRATVNLIRDAFHERRFDLLMIGGHRGSVEEFEPFLPAWLAKLVAGRFVVDPHTVTPAIVAARCAELEERYERKMEEGAVVELFDRASSGPYGVIGPWRTLDATNAHAVDHLLVDDRIAFPGRACEACGWIGMAERTCPICAAPAGGSVDIVDLIARRVVEDGGTVEHVLAATPLRGHVVGAFLRFPVPASARSKW